MHRTWEKEDKKVMIGNIGNVERKYIYGLMWLIFLDIGINKKRWYIPHNIINSTTLLNTISNRTSPNKSSAILLVRFYCK